MFMWPLIFLGLRGVNAFTYIGLPVPRVTEMSKQLADGESGQRIPYAQDVESLDEMTAPFAEDKSYHGHRHPPHPSPLLHTQNTAARAPCTYAVEDHLYRTGKSKTKLGKAAIISAGVAGGLAAGGSMVASEIEDLGQGISTAVVVGGVLSKYNNSDSENADSLEGE